MNLFDDDDSANANFQNQINEFSACMNCSMDDSHRGMNELSDINNSEKERNDSQSTQRTQSLYRRKISHWSYDENRRYDQFCIENYAILADKDSKDRKSNKIFQLMAEWIGTRDHDQCRSHHQKAFEKLKIKMNNGSFQSSSQPFFDVPSSLDASEPSSRTELSSFRLHPSDFQMICQEIMENQQNNFGLTNITIDYRNIQTLSQGMGSLISDLESGIHRKEPRKILSLIDFMRLSVDFIQNVGLISNRSNGHLRQRNYYSRKPAPQST